MRTKTAQLSFFADVARGRRAVGMLDIENGAAIGDFTMIKADSEGRKQVNRAFMEKIAPISIVAIACSLGAWAFDPLTGAFNYNDWISVLYIPAGIKVISMLALGVSATIGIFSGTLVWNALGKDLNIWISLIFSTITAASCLLAYCAIKFVAHGRGKYQWLPFSLSQTFIFVLVYSCLNAALHHLFFSFRASGGDLTFVSYLLMVFGDIAGAVSLYIFLNLATAGWLEFVRWWNLGA